MIYVRVVLPALAISTFIALHNMVQLRKAWARENKLHRMLSDQTANFVNQTELLNATTDNLNWAIDQLDKIHMLRDTKPLPTLDDARGILKGY